MVFFSKFSLGRYTKIKRGKALETDYTHPGLPNPNLTAPKEQNSRLQWLHHHRNPKREKTLGRSHAKHPVIEIENQDKDKRDMKRGKKGRAEQLLSGRDGSAPRLLRARGFG